MVFIPIRIKQLQQSFLLLLGHCANDVGVAGVGDGQGAHTEVLSAGGAQLVVVARVVMDAGLGQHGVVFDLRFPEEQK